MEDYESHMTSQGSPNATLGDIADFDAAEFEIKNPRDDAYSRDEKTDDEEE
jgi:hypothetical protein